MLGNVVSRVLGLAREQTIAALVGTTAAGSIFSAASRVPTMVYDLLVGCARPLMSALGVGFDPAVREQGILLVRIALPSVVLLGVSAVLMGVLYALHRVSFPSYAAAVYNVGIIVCALALWRWLGVTS